MNKEKLIVRISTLVSVFAFCFLTWLIYIKQEPVGHSEAFSFLPALNSIFNTCSAISLALGIYAIKQGRKVLHKALMATALVFSTLFLVSYVVYHSVHGDTQFLAQGIIRPIYFFVLISHILLTIGALPLILSTVGMALMGNFTLHKKLGRWTYPIWLYISVTGVLIYFMLRFFNV